MMLLSGAANQNQAVMQHTNTIYVGVVVHFWGHIGNAQGLGACALLLLVLKGLCGAKGQTQASWCKMCMNPLRAPQLVHYCLRSFYMT